jgi:hypothetical protein
VNKVDAYRQQLKTLSEWDAFLLRESGLPGRRANLELARAVAEEGDEELFDRYRKFDAERAPTNSAHEFLAFCGVLGLGKQLANGDKRALHTLRTHASDPRWRIREAVAMTLQRLGQADMGALLQEMETWSRGNLLERRAAVAALCEPRLLRDEAHAQRVLAILDHVTASMLTVEDRRCEAFRVLRKGLGYCWSVAVAAYPAGGKGQMARWFASDDVDVGWVMRENLRKARLARMDAAWVTAAKARLGM